MRCLDTNEIKLLKSELENKKKSIGVSKLRAAIYARKSAEDERQTSKPTQIEECKKFI